MHLSHAGSSVLSPVGSTGLRVCPLLSQLKSLAGLVLLAMLYQPDIRLSLETVQDLIGTFCLSRRKEKCTLQGRQKITANIFNKLRYRHKTLVEDKGC